MEPLNSETRNKLVHSWSVGFSAAVAIQFNSVVFKKYCITTCNNNNSCRALHLTQKLTKIISQNLNYKIIKLLKEIKGQIFMILG